MPHFLPHYSFFLVISETLAISSEILHEQCVCMRRTFVRATVALAHYCTEIKPKPLKH